MTKSIVFVDDQPSQLGSISRLIEREIPDISITYLVSGKMILESLSNGITRYDLIIMDGNLGGGYSGTYYTKSIIEIDPNAVIMGFSANELLRGEFMLCGAKDFIDKSATPNEILEIIKKALKI